MDGLQVDTSSREKAPPSQDSHKFVATQSHPVDTYTASPFSPDLNEHSASPLYEGKPEASERRRSFIPCGLSVLLYTILIAALTAIIVGGAVGGGVGGALSNKST